MQDKVSIITPSWNSEKYIKKTIESVQKQTYTNWEMIIVDDGSSDKTVEIVETFSKEDSRVKIIRQAVNAGAAKARNRSLSEATGRYISYLDADDIWKPTKIEKQVEFMKIHNCGFSCASYEVINDEGRALNKEVHMLPSVDYVGFLTNNLLQTVGIMVDTSIIDKKYLVMPDIRRRQDAATWLQVLKAGYKCYGIDEVLAEYRRAKNSLSSNKVKAVKGVWSLYRDIEKLSLPFSCYCFVRYVFMAVWKRMYRSKWRFMNARYRIGISGRYGNGIELLTGQAVKTKILDKALRDKYGNESVVSLDTYNWKKHSLKLFINCISMFKNAENIVFLPAQGGIKFFTIFYLILNTLFHRRLHYYVVGGWIVEKIEQDKFLERVLKKIDGIYVELDKMKAQLEEKGFKNIYYVNKFRQLNPIKEDEIPEKFDRPLKVCTFSRVMKEKGIEDACNAVKNANMHLGYIAYSLDIYGQIDTEYESEFNELCKNFPEYIHYCGQVVFEKSAEILKNYYLLLFPTVYHGEGYPNTLVDAFAAALPVIASDWKYNAELIRDGIDGIVYDYHNPRQLDNILIDLSQKEDYVRKMKSNCLKRCNEYIPQNAIKALVENIK